MFCGKFELFAALYDDSCEPQFFTYVFPAENFSGIFGKFHRILGDKVGFSCGGGGRPGADKGPEQGLGHEKARILNENRGI